MKLDFLVFSKIGVGCVGDIFFSYIWTKLDSIKFGYTNAQQIDIFLFWCFYYLED